MPEKVLGNGDEAVQAVEHVNEIDTDPRKRRGGAKAIIYLGVQPVLLGFPRRPFHLVLNRGQGLQAAVQAGWEPLPSQEGRENLGVFKAAFTNPGLIPPRRAGVKWGDPAGCHLGQAHLCLPSSCRFPGLSEDS